MYVQETPVPVLGATHRGATQVGRPIVSHESVSMMIGAGQTIQAAHTVPGYGTVYSPRLIQPAMQAFVYSPTLVPVRNPAAATSTRGVYRLLYSTGGQMSGGLIQLPAGTLVTPVG